MYVFGSDRVLLRDMHVNEVNAEQISQLIVGQKGHSTVLNCNLCQVYDDATLVVVEATIDASENLPSATSSYADFASTGRGRMRFVNMDLSSLELTAREQGVLELYNCTGAVVDVVDPTAQVVQLAHDADFTATLWRGEAPLTTSFIDLSAGDVSSHLWAFGDGGSSSLMAPGYQYTTAGIYTVALTAAGPGWTDTETKEWAVLVGVVFADGFESGTLTTWSSHTR